LTDVFGLGFGQTDVDFVIPDLARDLRLAIDPFLLFKSRNPEYKRAHDQLLSVFNEAIGRYSRGDIAGAASLISFPEVNEIGFGYTAKGIHGTGLGEYLNRLVLDTLGASPELVQRGIRHVEEMQLVSLGIGPDRVSDIAANVLKGFLIEYTQNQAQLWNIPVERGVPVHNAFDFDGWRWGDGYYDLPVNPLAHPPRPILLVPRRIVRMLPWINFDDYQRMEFGLFLRAREVRQVLRKTPRERIPTKEEIVGITRREVHRIDHYVDAKERDAHHADPEPLVTASPQLCDKCDQLIEELQGLTAGVEQAQAYQDLMFRVFNLLFEPDLIEGKKQVRTEHGTEIRDLIYTNDSDRPFWDFVRNNHGNLAIVIELKNKSAIDNRDIDQLAGYLGDATGYLGLLAARQPWSEARRLKAIAWYNKGTPHRVIVGLSDHDIVRMLQMKCAGNEPTAVVRQAYQDYMAKIQ
jgi:hypothetical protein